MVMDGCKAGGRNLMKLLICTAFFLAAGTAGAAQTNGYALVVGSHRAGPGQEELRYAGHDARRMVEVLTELSGYATENVRLVLDPGREELLQEIAGIREKLKMHADRGEQSVFLFFYSGHARAHALNMGAEEILLTELRDKLTGMPATLTLAILDACQTGAISRVKGAEPSADFSFNSVNKLNTEGVVVMASSSGSELSQESESLGASYFTHHLVVGLRGAADQNADGRVTLSEAYGYTYNRTLIATAATAVGKQHVTLETDLRGKGEMVLSYPAEANSAMWLSEELSGDLLVHRAPNQTVVAELVKAQGRPVRLAFPAGDYVVFMRNGDQILKCVLALGRQRTTELIPGNCEEAAPEEMGIKGAADDGRYEKWSLELAFGASWRVRDGYNQTLTDFGFEEQSLFFEHAGALSVSAIHSFTRYLSVVLSFSFLDRNSYDRHVWDLNNQDRMENFEWSSYGIGVYVRGTLPIFDGVLNPYIQVGVGLTWADTVLADPIEAGTEVDDEIFTGYQLGAAIGLQLMPWQSLGFFWEGSYVFAPTIENLMEDVHDSGGLSLCFGIRGAL
jgi:hypothetical protein